MAKKKRYLDDNPPYITYQQPVDDGVLVPYNPNFVPTYNLPEVSVAASNLPKTKATDANIERYANAVANNQIKLTQIPDTELRNAVRAKPIVDKIREDTDKTALPILAGTIGLPAGVIGASYAAPTVWSILNNPIFNAAQTVHGAITAPRNIKQGIRSLKEGNYSKGALDLGLTALDLHGGVSLVKHGKNAAKRLAEVLVRQGDELRAITPKKGLNLLTKQTTTDYVLNGGKHPELAYKTGNYSGNTVAGNGDRPHEGDVVDAFFGKPRNKNEYVKELTIDDLSPKMQKYIEKNYGRRKNKIKVFDLGEVKDIDKFSGNSSYGLYKELNDGTTKYVLDPGGYRRIDIPDEFITKHFGEDIWKFNPKDYDKRYKLYNDDPALPDKIRKRRHSLKMLGLNFINRMGTPVVHKWYGETPVTFKDVVGRSNADTSHLDDLIEFFKNYI